MTETQLANKIDLNTHNQMISVWLTDVIAEPRWYFQGMNQVFNQINSRTNLADGWDWNEMFWNWLLDSNFNCAQIEAINDFPVEQSTRKYLYNS